MLSWSDPYLEEYKGDMMEAVKKLAAYALATGLIEQEDIIYTVNSLLLTLGLESAEYEISDIEALAGEISTDEKELSAYLEGVLKEIDDFAVEKGLIENDSVVYRDLFDTKVMGLLTERPSAVIAKFKELYKKLLSLFIIFRYK